MGRLGGYDSRLHRRHCEDTPTEGIGHSFPGAEMLQFRDVQASLESVVPGCSPLWLHPSPILLYPVTFGVFLFYSQPICILCPFPHIAIELAFLMTVGYQNFCIFLILLFYGLKTERVNS